MPILLFAFAMTVLMLGATIRSMLTENRTAG
jgi:hypothetical protein